MQNKTSTVKPTIHQKAFSPSGCAGGTDRKLVSVRWFVLYREPCALHHTGRPCDAVAGRHNPTGTHTQVITAHTHTQVITAHTHTHTHSRGANSPEIAFHDVVHVVAGFGGEHF